MLRGIFGALKSSVQYCVGVKSRLLSLLLYLHQFSKLWKLLTFYTTCWTVKSQFSWSVVNVPGGGGKACLRSLGRASFSCVPPHFQSHRVLLFWNPGSLLWEWLGRTLELPCFHRCSLKGGWKCDSETHLPVLKQKRSFWLVCHNSWSSDLKGFLPPQHWDWEVLKIFQWG